MLTQKASLCAFCSLDLASSALAPHPHLQASDIVKKGKMCSLFINDLDAGAGRMGEGTQYTVNNQMVGVWMSTYRE